MKPLIWRAAIPHIAERPDPTLKFFQKVSIVEARLPQARMHDTPAKLILKTSRHAWTCAPEIDKVVANQNSIYACVTTDVFEVGAAVRQAVKRVTLAP
ncbi:hypothetical protein XI03_12370 [Bradyrhizobium sp. CCBAU 65884]|nr:hypothetical protein [Bradyrhizobium sp. CCBAU 65884]